MADEKGTQKPKERVKYKFGQNDIDLTNYIHNLGTNVQSYLNSKNWNEGQKQEFMNAYNRYLTGLQDQLANNTNRFTTDDFGSIIDSTGALSNTDNDDIDPVGSEYYYDNKGNRITTDDFNLLKKRKQKNYNTFSANREVATYFNTIGNALKGMETPKEKVQDAFNLSKHGFLADWTTANNPAGGDFNLDPYLEKDAMDETTGKRGTSNRAAYLKEQIENYINNIGEYDFSSSPFKNRDTYISRLRAAAQNLENGYNSEDVIALNQAGIGNEFLSKFFATGAEEAPIKKSELELQAEQAAKEQAEREKEDQLRAVIKANEEDKYNRERDAFFTDYATQNPFQSTISGYATPSYNLQGTYNWLQGRYKFGAGNMDATKEAVKTYINFPELASIIRGGKKADNKGNDITALHIANNLDLAAQSDLLTDKVGDTGYYVVPGSENYDNWSYIAYNPVTRQYQEQSMLLNEELKKKMAYAEYDRRHKGVQKHQLGGIAKYVEENQKKAQKEAEKQRRIDEKVEETGKTREQVEAAERRPMEEGFSTIDKVRLGTAAADAAAAAAAFIPGYGTVASGVLGIGSTLTNIGADIADESMSGWDVAGNALYGLGTDVVGLIPGLGTTGKAAKIVRVLKPVSKLAMRTLQAYGMIHSADAFNKLMSNPSDMSADDWRNLVTGLQAISGEARYKGVQKHQLGGIAKYVEENQKKAQKEAEKQRRIDEKVEETGKTREQVEAAERRPMEEGFSTIDKVRLGTAAADAAAAAAAFIPGYGTVASGVLGIGSTLTNIGADIADESMSGWDVAGNALYGLGTDVVGLIPGLGTTGKAAKIVRVLKPVSKLAMRTLQAYGMIHSADAFNKLMSNPSDMSADDWRNLVTGLQAISGEARYKGGKRAVSRATTQRDVADVKTSTGRVATISKEDLDKLRKTKGLKAQNKLFSELTGGQQLQREFKDREINWKKPWKSRLSSDSPEVSLRTESSFLPEDNSWDARLFRGMNRNTPQRKPQKKQQETPQSRFDRLRQLSSQTGKLTPQEIATINRQRVKSGKGKLTEQEIQALNQRRQNRAGDGTDNSFQARLQRYKDAKREGKFTSVEDDIKRAKDELAEATRQQRLAVPTGQGEIVSPDANQARFIIGFSRAIPTVNPSRPPISNPPAIIPKQQVRIEQPQQSPFNYDRIREGLARAERERLGKDIGEQRLQRAIEANPERSARLQSEEAHRNVRQAFNLYGAPQYKRPLTGAAYKAKQDMYNRLFNQRRYDVIEAFRNRELPHRQSNKKKKTSRDDRRTAKREDGGTLDLVRVRKFQNAGKFPEWYSKLYKFQNLTGWNNSLNQSLAGPSITNENVGHYRAGDLNEAYTKNNSYTSNPNLVGQDLQSYYDSSFKGKSLDDYVSAYNANAAKIRGYWDQERTYKQSGAQEHNRLFKNMFGNRSDNSNNVWNIGYDSNLEDIVGSSTWLRRMDRYEKEFDNLSDEEKKSRIHKIDLGDGNFGYVYKKANGDIAVWNQPETPATSTNPADSQTTPTITSVIQPSQEPSDDNKQNKSFFSNINPTIAYGLPRAVYADRMNRRITDLAKESVVPLLKDPFEVHRYTRSDLDAEMQGERNYANLRRLASRPITSDGSLQTATQLQAEVQGQEARTAGKEKSNQVQRQYDELAWQQEKENAANRHETAMFNRAQQWGADQDKSKYEQAYLAKKFNIWDVFGQQLEYDARTRQKENKALADNFARSDIHNAISYAPNDYGANLTPDELTVWNKVLSGTNPSSLSSQEFNSYKLAAQKVSRVETEQLRQYYNVPNTRWSGKTPSTPWSPTISKAISAKNGAKIAVAGIEAKTADAERFQKQIKECIDRNEKAIDRLSKSLYGLIKASMIK